MHLSLLDMSLRVLLQLKLVFVFASIHEELFPLPHYCEMGDLASAMSTA